MVVGGEIGHDFPRIAVNLRHDRLDDVVDFIQAVAETFVIYDISKPTSEARDLAKILAAVRPICAPSRLWVRRVRK